MSYSIEYRRRSGEAGSLACPSAALNQATVQQLLSRHAEHGHVLESAHGRVEVREPDGERVAEYWFVA